MNIICSSGGNDSVALMQWAKSSDLDDVYVIYSNTKWSIDWWSDRMDEIRLFCNGAGFKYIELTSEGFESMVRRKKGFPMPASKMQFCSDILKTRPLMEWLSEHDPQKKAVIYTGKRREESQNRKNHPHEIVCDMRYDGRTSRHPLVEHTEKERDFLIEDTEIDLLLHSSMECFPCVNSNRADIRLLSKYPDRINQISKIETDMGLTSKGKPRVMFRPYRHMGATGIKEVVKWGLADRGKYNKS